MVRVRGSDGQDEQPSLRELVQRRLLSDVFENANKVSAGWKILVVDESSMKVISAAIGMYDMMERRITLVEALEKKRAPFPDKGVIYILEPCGESIQMLLDDYNPKERKKPLYGKDVFLFFLGRLPDSLLDEIKQCRPLLRRIKALSEVNINFLAREARAFDFDLRNEFPSYYMREKGSSPSEMIVAERLVTVCATLNEYPHIRYRSSSGISTSLAKLFHRKMDEFVAANPKWWYYGGGQTSQATSRDRSVLLLLDRADDCLTPLMHDFTYQPMVRDLIPMEGDRMTYENKTADGDKEEKDVLLNEKDELWTELRDKHIAEVIKVLQERIKDIMQSKAGAAFGGQKDGNMSLADMAAAVKAVPEYREVISKLSQHMHISDRCMTTFTRDNLMELSEMEQTLATGTDDDGNTPQLDSVVDQAERFLKIMSNAEARLRLILIVTISQGGLSSQDRRRLLNAAELERKEVDTMNNLEQMGISIFSTSGPKKLTSKFAGLSFTNTTFEEDEESEYVFSRFNPVLKGVLYDMLINGNLSFEHYPSVLPMPEATASTGAAASARRTRGARGDRGKTSRDKKRGGGASDKWSQASGGAKGDSKGKKEQAVFTGPRTLVFIVGGISYTELRVCREFSTKHQREIIVGSTSFCDAESFMTDLGTLKHES